VNPGAQAQLNSISTGLSTQVAPFRQTPRPSTWQASTSISQFVPLYPKINPKQKNLSRMDKSTDDRTCESKNTHVSMMKYHQKKKTIVTKSKQIQRHTFHKIFPNWLNYS
jgi:hypothetical protein